MGESTKDEQKINQWVVQANKNTLDRVQTLLTLRHISDGQLILAKEVRKMQLLLNSVTAWTWIAPFLWAGIVYFLLGRKL